MVTENKIDEVLQKIKKELLKANEKHPPFNSAPEGYAVLLEEVDEMWDDIKQNLYQHSVTECVQVGAMAVKYILSIQDLIDNKHYKQ